jgi:SAM-dependent methyltransferase
MKDHNQHKYKGIVVGFIHQLLQVDLIRYFISRVRFIYFVKIRRKLRTLENPHKGVAKNTISHNLKGITDYAAVRPLALVKPLSVIESLSKDSKILTIGPRTEGEMLALVGYGFLPKNIVGLDLITYSPWVDIGDMHEMPYEENSFDVVLAGWVIAYSHDPYIAAKEMIRVVKPGGIIAIGVEYGVGDPEALVGYIPGAGRTTNSVNQITKYFTDHLDFMYFSHGIIDSRKTIKGSVIAIFSIKK